MTIHKKLGKAYEVILLGGILLIMGLILYTNLFHYCYRMNADVASEAVLARYLWESGEWLPESWFPSTEYRILSSANLAALFYGIFQDMALAMGSACVVLTFGVLGSFYFFISQFPFQREEKLLFILLCLVLPNHFMMLELFYLFGAYYAIHIILLFLSLGIYVRLLGGACVSLVWPAVLSFFSFVVGMQGLRGILVLNIPMLVTETIRQASLLYERNWKKRDAGVAVWCVLMLFAGCVGTFMPYSVGQETSRNIRKGFAKLWKTVLPEVFDALGFGGVEGVGRVIPVSLLLIAIGVLAGCVIRILKKRGAEPLIWAYILMWMSLGVMMAAVAFTTTKSSRRYYFMILPVMAFGFICLWHYAGGKRQIFRIFGYAGIMFLFVLQMRTIYMPIIWSEEPAYSAEREVCRYLQEHHYETAYASFDKGNVLTVLSGGAVRGAAVASFERMDMCRWLSSMDWYAPNMPYQSRTAYVVSESDKETFEKFCSLHSESVWLETEIDGIYIYGSEYNLSSL